MFDYHSTVRAARNFGCDAVSWLANDLGDPSQYDCCVYLYDSPSFLVPFVSVSWSSFGIICNLSPGGFARFSHLQLLLVILYTGHLSIIRLDLVDAAQVSRRGICLWGRVIWGQSACIVRPFDSSVDICAFLRYGINFSNLPALRSSLNQVVNLPVARASSEPSPKHSGACLRVSADWVQKALHHAHFLCNRVVSFEVHIFGRQRFPQCEVVSSMRS